MRQTEKEIFAICDPEEGYALRMSEYLLKKVRIPYAVHLFTAPDELRRFLEKREIKVSLMAESMESVLREEGVAARMGKVFLLQETQTESAHDGSGNAPVRISKYQEPEQIVSQILENLGEEAAWYTTAQESACRLVGVYSPVRRCLQTPFAMTMGQMLARQHRVLYLNFECYSGMRQLLNREFSADIMDVMYYFRCARDKLAVRIAAITQNINGLDYIPPVCSSLDFREIRGEQWVELCRELAAIGEYEYLLLDLDDGMNGLFDLLKECCRIYTITKDDRAAVAKMTHYEEVLRFHNREDISERTRKCRFPVFSHIPQDLTAMTHGDLARYVRAIIQEDLYGA